MAQVVIPGFRKIETCKEGTGDYNSLSNIPFINNVPVKGNLKTEDLKLTDSTLTKKRCSSKDRYGWWLLSSLASNSTNFTYVGNSGYSNYISATIPRIATPVCFRI